MMTRVEYIVAIQAHEMLAATSHLQPGVVT